MSIPRHLSLWLWAEAGASLWKYRASIRTLRLNRVAENGYLTNTWRARIEMFSVYPEDPATVRTASYESECPLEAVSRAMKAAQGEISPTVQVFFNDETAPASGQEQETGK